MRWRAVAAGMALAGGLMVNAGAPGESAAQQTPVGGAWVRAEGARPPDPPAEVVLPPHLTGGPPLPAGAGPDFALPTLQDLMQVSPTYEAPPPARRRRR